jgi:polyhydroxyalkanoate synthase subunit PhaC
VISWVNPDKRLGNKSWEDYMKEGPLTAMDVIEKVTGEMKVHTAGYCVGGTMLATTLAWLAEKRRQRVSSATFFAAQVDFTHAGDLLVFVDEEQIASLEQDMKAAGVLEGSKMAMAFNMLRSNDLIWSYVVSNYLKGQQPSAFDLLHWNSDATRMTASNHSYYLRNCYLENRLSTGTMVLDNTLLDLSKVKVPVYNLATREDHIAPAESVLYGSQFFGGPVKYVLSGSGHIAGVVNPPASNKYQYWTNDNIKDVSVAEWMKGAVEHKGSWWPDWRQWLGELDPEQVPARLPGSEAFPPIEDAPGSYVRVRA